MWKCVCLCVWACVWVCVFVCLFDWKCKTNCMKDLRFVSSKLLGNRFIGNFWKHVNNTPTTYFILFFLFMKTRKSYKLTFNLLFRLSERFKNAITECFHNLNKITMSFGKHIDRNILFDTETILFTNFKILADENQFA